ncbi:N-acetylmuramoyl-L-alanine amidase [Clostridium sp. CF012]|uniref:N-acetylmuramoyl-L-alanine amidase n=1 Tax=Clostridium sp. CF012 TaxID=2843319 RepID=UPI001C0D4CB3|nr:N-acetylmuramoyl-L-alanine amidase [Clostridium sp. CF012]MBU3145205.1 N-acetylmuramoyl-L-alanine amidase [Clostridium sp. CF012]
MKNIFKAFIFMILTFALCIPMQIIVKASTYTDGPTKPSDFTVCIDPAQYFKEITGENGAKAKDINLNTALKLGNILKTRGFKVVYTRDSDSVSWNSLNEDDAKAAIAKNANADVFLSINTNYYSLNTSNGIETYYLSDVSNKNKLLAGLMQSELIKATDASDRGIKEGSFELLKKTSCPAVVLELGFLSNPEEEILLTREDYQNNVAKAIANGLMKYAGFANTDTNYDSIFSVSSVGDIIVNLEVGNKYTFPKTVLATMSNNSKKEIGVEWLQDIVSLTKVGTYTYEGVIENYDKKVKVIINVKEAVSAKYKVVLDAGHGGADSGAVGAMGTKEKAIVLAITLKVGNILAKNGVDVVYTRTIDKTQSLQAKCDVSNIAKPNYFVSIHANSYSVPTVSGIETFYKRGSAVGQKLAQAVQTELIKATGRVDRKIKTAGYYVLNNTRATAILVETSFLSNATEEKLLVTLAYQTKLAQAISKGILKSLGIIKIVF